jgi:DNA-binding MarR family transcriptional regulator
MQVLIQIWLEPGLPVSDIAERLALDRATVSAAVATLGRDGLIQDSEKSPADARRRHQRVSRSGRQVVERFLAEA